MIYINKDKDLNLKLLRKAFYNINKYIILQYILIVIDD